MEDETLACGTGCIASAVVAGALGKASSPVTAHTRGGFILKVYFRLTENGAKDVFLEGDARLICIGQLQQDSWDY